MTSLYKGFTVYRREGKEDVLSTNAEALASVVVGSCEVYNGIHISWKEEKEEWFCPNG